MDSLNLSKVNFTNRADVVDPGVTIFNPKFSHVSTLRGADRLIGTSTLDGDFGLGILVGVEANNFDLLIKSTEFTANANLTAQGIDNEGIINTNRGNDLVKGTAIANISATTSTVSQVIAIAETADTKVINNVFASLDIQATAYGIDNSGGKINTNQGDDRVNGEINGSLSAIATATADASAIVEAIAGAPMSDNLQAFANAIATSFTTATISATAINNRSGSLNTGKGNDTINAKATSSTSTFAGTSSSTFSSAPPENQALAMAVADAVAETSDLAIAIENTEGRLRTGKGADMIQATAEASELALAVDNTKGYITLDQGKDIIEATAKASELAIAIGNAGGRLRTGKGADRIDATAEASELAIAIGNAEGRLRTGKGADTIHAIIEAADLGIAIDNTKGYITLDQGKDTIEATAKASGQAIAIGNAEGRLRTGKGADTILATAEAADLAIAIENTGGTIRTGKGADTILAQATGAESYGIFGGTIDLGNGNDFLMAGTFGGGISIDAGSGDDWVEGFGDAKVYGGQGFDTLSLGSYSIENFLDNDNGNNISFGANSDVSFNLDGITLNATGFEQFNFADDVTYTYDQLATV